MRRLSHLLQPAVKSQSSGVMTEAVLTSSIDVTVSITVKTAVMNWNAVGYFNYYLLY